MREKFCQKLLREYREFQKRVLSKKKSEIFGKSYEIDVFNNFYGILLEKANKLPDEILENLLEESGLLESLYQRWLKKEDSHYCEMEEYVESEIRNFVNDL